MVKSICSEISVRVTNHGCMKKEIRYVDYIITGNRANLDKLNGCNVLYGLEQDLTLEEVCPIWSQKLGRGLDLKDRYILANDSKNCLVGEAWGFTGKQAGYYIAPLIPLIGCWTCIKYGKKLGKIAENNDNVSGDFRPLISAFLMHWNKAHRNITNKMKHLSKMK